MSFLSCRSVTRLALAAIVPMVVGITAACSSPAPAPSPTVAMATRPPSIGTSPTAVSGAAGGGSANAKTIDVEMVDNEFKPKEITLNAGEAVVFNVKNKGTAIHNMRIAGDDNQFNTPDDAVTKDLLVNPDGSSTLTWTPKKAGTVKFQCDIHLPDMVGTITVK